MLRLPLFGWLFVAGAIFAAVAAVLEPSAAEAQEKVSRDDLINAFDDLNQQAKKAYDAKGFTQLKVPRAKGGGLETLMLYQGEKPPRFKGVQVAGTEGNQQLMVKVWAVPLKDGKELPKVVHLEKYRWNPKEQFAIYFETAVPVQIGFYQEFPDEGKSSRVLPDKNFPSSYDTIKPGKPYRFPVQIEMDNNIDDEYMSIVIAAAGSDPDLPPKDPNAVGAANQPAIKHAIFSKKYTDALDKKAEEARKLPRFRATTADDSAPNEGNNSDNVATIGYGPDQHGLLKLKLTKKKANPNPDK